MHIYSRENMSKHHPQIAIIAENMMLNHGNHVSRVVPIFRSTHIYPYIYPHIYPHLPSEFPAASAAWSTTHVPRRAAGASAARRCADPRGHQTGPGPGIEIKKRETQL